MGRFESKGDQVSRRGVPNEGRVLQFVGALGVVWASGCGRTDGALAGPRRGYTQRWDSWSHLFKGQPVSAALQGGTGVYA